MSDQQALDNMNAAQKPTWGMSDVWNKALTEREERPVTARNRLWASELGRPAIDTYLKMNGIAYTNPPNVRALRKFEAGNVFEWIVSLVLKRAAILKSGQTWCSHQYPGLLEVSGKADFIAGGNIDYKTAHEFIEFLKRAEIPDVFLRCFDRVLNYLKETYPNGVEEMPLEIKSISAYAMDLMERTPKANPMHRRQLFHYLKALNYRKGNIVYICRDDLRMMEFPVFNDAETEQEYKSAIEAVSTYYFKNEQPPLEKLVIFDEEYGKFSKNIGVEWSPYLKMLYGFDEPREYGEIYGKMASSWNRVMKRVKTSQEREKWLSERKMAEKDIQKDKIEGTRKSGPQYVVLNGEKVEIPALLQNGHNITPANQVILESIEKEGFNIAEIAGKFHSENVADEESDE